MDITPTSKATIDSIINRINELENKVNLLEKKNLKIERTKINLIPKTTLSKESLFEKDIAVSDNIKAVIIGINFANSAYISSGLNHNLNFQIYRKELMNIATLHFHLMIHMFIVIIVIQK